MLSDLDCRAPRACACANLVPIPRALKNYWSHLKVAYYSFSETQLRALRNSLLRHFFRACNTFLHHREKAENTSEIWLGEIARGVL